MKKAFSLVELLVVVGMIAILMGAVGSSLSKARKRAMIAKATQDVKEMTNAIAALANYTRDHTLEPIATESWEPATESSLAMILGGTVDGRQVPVLYNAHIRNGKILDPWGNNYEFTVRKSNTVTPNAAGVTYKTAIRLPNFYRLSDKERQ